MKPVMQQWVPPLQRNRLPPFGAGSIEATTTIGAAGSDPAVRLPPFGAGSIEAPDHHVRPVDRPCRLPPFGAGSIEASIAALISSGSP